jgi:hypothetical protein
MFCVTKPTRKAATPERQSSAVLRSSASRWPSKSYLRIRQMGRKDEGSTYNFAFIDRSRLLEEFVHCFFRHLFGFVVEVFFWLHVAISGGACACKGREACVMQVRKCQTWWPRNNQANRCHVLLTQSESGLSHRVLYNTASLDVYDWRMTLRVNVILA